MFASTGGCGADAAAGRNGNRTSFTDTKDAGTTTTVAYCYDNADRLTSTTVGNPPMGPGGPAPVAGSNLTSSTLQYDTHGNTSTLPRWAGSCQWTRSRAAMQTTLSTPLIRSTCLI